MIQIAAYQGTSFISRLIRWQTRSVYSHIAVRFTKDIWVKRGGGRESLINAGAVVEAWNGGVRQVRNLSAAHTPGTRVDLFEFVIPLSETEEQAFAAFLLSQVGKGYDYRAIFRFITRAPINHWNKTKWFCSELAFEACLTAGRDLLARTAAWKVPPAWVPMSPLLKYTGREITT